MRRALLLALVLGFAGCGFASGPDYRGAALFTLGGTMTLAPGVKLERPVRLAVIWYAQVDSRTPKGTVTEDVAFEGQFPLRFTMPFYSPPDEAVLSELPGISGRVGNGQLVAYDDLDGDERLTIAGLGQTVTDRVLAVTALSPLQPASFTGPWRMIAYAEPGAAPALGLRAGFNLVEVSPITNTTELVEPELELELSDDPLLSGTICVEAYNVPSMTLPCGIVTSSLGLLGLVTAADDGAAYARVGVFADGRQIDGATVTLNGVALAQGMPQGPYELFETSRRVIRLGTNLVRVEAPAQVAKEAVAEVPKAFIVDAPATVKAGRPFTMTWTPAEGAGTYSVRASTGMTIGAVNGFGFSGTAPPFTGPLELWISALGGDGYFRGEYLVHKTIEVVP